MVERYERKISLPNSFIMICSSMIVASVFALAILAIVLRCLVFRIVI